MPQESHSASDRPVCGIPYSVQVFSVAFSQAGHTQVAWLKIMTHEQRLLGCVAIRRPALWLIGNRRYCRQADRALHTLYGKDGNLLQPLGFITGWLFCRSETVIRFSCRQEHFLHFARGTRRAQRKERRKPNFGFPYFSESDGG